MNAKWKESKLRRFTYWDGAKKIFFSDINTVKRMPKKNCWNLPTSLKCFACIYYHWKKNYVQSLYAKRRSLLSLHLGCNLEFVMFFMKKVMSYFSMSSMNSSIPLLLFGSVAVLDTILMSISFLTSSGTDGISLKKEKKINLQQFQIHS